MPVKPVSIAAKSKNSTRPIGPSRKQLVPTGVMATDGALPTHRAAGGARKPGPKRHHRTDITLPPTVVNAVEEHARAVGIPQTEYHRLAVAAFFKSTLLEPPAVKKVRCGECGRDIRETKDRSGFKRVRIGVRFDVSTVDMMKSLAEDYYDLVWSRAFEAALRFYLGDRNPPPEGFGKEPGVQRTRGRPKGSKNHSTKLKEKRLAGIQAQLDAAEAAGKAGA